MSSAGRNTGADPNGIKQNLIKLKTEKKRTGTAGCGGQVYRTAENRGVAGQTVSRGGAREGRAQPRQRQEAPLTPRGRSRGGEQVAGISNRTKPSREQCGGIRSRPKEHYYGFLQSLILPV